MSDLTQESDRVLREARIVRDDNRAGGRHRKVSIGQESKRIKRTNWVKRIRNVMIAIFAIWVAGGIAGAIAGGLIGDHNDDLYKELEGVSLKHFEKLGGITR